MNKPAPPQFDSGFRATVMGLGEFGGGVGAVRFLLDRGVRVTVTDLRTAEQLQASLVEIDPARLERLVLGEHRIEDFQRADLIVVNPAVKRRGNPYLQAALDAGTPLTSEMNLFWQHCRGRIIAVTGTVGKSTTASLIHHVLRSAGLPARIGGNIGVSLLPEVSSITEREWIVLELSSFQLDALQTLEPRPDVAVITNFHPNHLDWHGTLEEYRAAKQSLLRWQSAADVAVLNADDADVSAWTTRASSIWFGATDQPGGVRVGITADRLFLQRSADRVEIDLHDVSPPLRFPHQRWNMAAALGAVVFGAGLEAEQAARALATFPGLPHRLQVVGEFDGRRYINDSKATTPEATLAALAAIQGPLTLIAGGKDKGVDLTPLGDAIARRAGRVALIGETASALGEIISASHPDRTLISVGSLGDAVAWARSQSRPGETILLSPGCASHGEFVNYEQRGEAFRQLVLESAPRP